MPIQYAEPVVVPDGTYLFTVTKVDSGTRKAFRSDSQEPCYNFSGQCVNEESGESYDYRFKTGTIYGYPTARFTILLNALTGKVWTGKALAKMDIQELIGKTCRVNIQNQTGNSGDSVPTLTSIQPTDDNETDD